jgi:hypothetical protein
MPGSISTSAFLTTLLVSSALSSFVIQASNGPAVRAVDGLVVKVVGQAPGVLRVCIYGDAYATCAPGMPTGRQSINCDFVTPDCVCYRWQFDRIIAPFGTVTAASGAKTPHCGVLRINTDGYTSGFNVTVGFALAHFQNIIPPAWNRYVAHAFQTWVGRQKTTYDVFRQTLLEKMCLKNSNYDSLDINPDCYSEVTIPIVPVQHVRMKKSSNSLVSGIVVCLFLVLVLGASKAVEIYSRARDPYDISPV